MSHLSAGRVRLSRPGGGGRDNSAAAVLGRAAEYREHHGEEHEAVGAPNDDGEEERLEENAEDIRAGEDARTVSDVAVWRSGNTTHLEVEMTRTAMRVLTMALNTEGPMRVSAFLALSLAEPVEVTNMWAMWAE